MSAFEKLIQKIFNSSQISYDDAARVLLKLEYMLRVRGSHHGFRKDGHKQVILKRRSQLKPYQLSLLQEVLRVHGYEKEH
jgi:predicted RNA binding protein YcfA (HicA-like mRNA interferase family)